MIFFLKKKTKIKIKIIKQIPWSYCFGHLTTRKALKTYLRVYKSWCIYLFADMLVSFCQLKARLQAEDERGMHGNAIVEAIRASLSITCKDKYKTRYMDFYNLKILFRSFISFFFFWMFCIQIEHNTEDRTRIVSRLLWWSFQVYHVSFSMERKAVPGNVTYHNAQWSDYISPKVTLINMYFSDQLYNKKRAKFNNNKKKKEKSLSPPVFFSG